MASIRTAVATAATTSRRPCLSHAHHITTTTPLLTITTTNKTSPHHNHTNHITVQKRHFMGLTQLLGVIANPAETLRQLNESKDLLRKAKEDLELRNESKKIPKKHTFSKLPGFHGRETEQALLRKILSHTPKLSVLFGATSVGKTALLREVLASEGEFYVIKFDLRISGFADLRTLYLALCEQFERFFADMHDEEMDKQRLTFKHLILELEEKEKEENGGYQVSVADIASLMESLQSCLLKYWEYNPPERKTETEDADDNGKNPQASSSSSGDKDERPQERRVDTLKNDQEVEKRDDNSAGDVVKNKIKETKDSITKTDGEQEKEKEEEEQKKVFKKRPVVFLMDEAHKLPALVDDPLSLKVFLDTLLVLTKQDRLCHVLLSTSDSFFHHFLRSMNVGHHAQILTIGDCTKEETRTYFADLVEKDVPDELKQKINFEEIYDAFGGKLSHIADYIASWVNSGGEITPYTSAIFTQAYTLLQFHITHTDFETYSPLSTATAGKSSDDDKARFSPDDLLYVMKELVKSPYSLPYFRLCREIGTAQVDSMIKTRVLDLRWTKSVSPEDEGAERVWSEDGIERPIVLPMTRIVRKAMEVVLKEDEELKIGEAAEEKAEQEKHSRGRKDGKKYDDDHDHDDDDGHKKGKKREKEYNKKSYKDREEENRRKVVREQQEEKKIAGKEGGNDPWIQPS